MKIAFVTFGNFDGHATLKRATGMAEPLANLGHEVYILIEDCRINREKIVQECPGIEAHWHTRSKLFWHERSQKQCNLQAIDPDIVWICGVGPRNWVTHSKSKQIILADHSELLSAIGGIPLHRRMFEYVLEWSHLYAFDGNICASRFLQRLYSERNTLLGLQNRVYYAPYAYNAKSLHQPLTIYDELKKRLTNKKLIFYMGSFRENYGFWDMLKVSEELSTHRDDFHIMIAGRGPEAEAGRGWIKSRKLANTISLLGYVEEKDLSSYFKIAHAFLCPLRNTIQDIARCPSKLFMYIPYRKPIITCKVGEASELLGDDAFYYEPQDMQGMKRCMEEVLELEKWEPSVKTEIHSWNYRASNFLDWMKTTFGDLT